MEALTLIADGFLALFYSGCRPSPIARPNWKPRLLATTDIDRHETQSILRRD